ncbi:MAG: hypothetical protein ABIT83_23210 [Massilia sp.]
MKKPSVTSPATLPVTLLALALLSACAATPPDPHFGESVRQARLAMTINPHAGENPDLAAGVDGGAAREAIQRYQDSFKAPPPVVNIINIGTGAAK